MQKKAKNVCLRHDSQLLLAREGKSTTGGTIRTKGTVTKGKLRKYGFEREMIKG